jgi:hypothetical protein
MFRRPLARRAIRRRRGRRLLGAAVVGGTGYYAGKKIAEGRQAEAAQDQEISDLQDQVDNQQAASSAATQPQAPAPSAAPGGGSDTVASLQELASLHASGVLSDDEFAAAKQKVLSGK